MTAKETYLSNVLQQLQDFLKTDWPPNLWIENTAIKVYVRQSLRRVSMPFTPPLTYFDLASMIPLTCLDIANITITERYRQQGFFTDFVMRAHEMHAFEMTYIESIENPIILQWCSKREWTLQDTYSKHHSDSYFLLKHAVHVKSVLSHCQNEEAKEPGSF